MKTNTASLILLLKSARALITKRCLRHEMAVTINGNSVRPDDVGAVAFCPVGALIRLQDQFGRKAVEKTLYALHEAAKRDGEPSFGEFVYRRNHRQILNLYDNTIKIGMEDPSIFKKPRSPSTRRKRSYL